MADECSSDGIRKQRGRYRQFLRHSNPYKFAAARRRKTGRSSLHKTGRSRTVSQNGSDRTECVFTGAEEPTVATCELTNLPDDHESRLEQVHETDNTLSDDFCCFEEVQDEDEISQFEFEETRDAGLGEDEVLDFTSYGRFVMDEAGSDVFSDCENIDSDSESIPEQCDKEHDDALYSGAPITSSSSVVLLLSFVFKHKLTREAFSDLLAVVEAHCPRPNNCRTTVKKLFEFVSQAKGDIVKHYFCAYCNAYYGRVEDRTEVNRTCNICGKNIPEAGRFFIEVPIAKQLRKFFSGKCIDFSRLELLCSSYYEWMDGFQVNVKGVVTIVPV